MNIDDIRFASVSWKRCAAFCFYLIFLASVQSVAFSQNTDPPNFQVQGGVAAYIPEVSSLMVLKNKELADDLELVPDQLKALFTDIHLLEMDFRKKQSDVLSSNESRADLDERYQKIWSEYQQKVDEAVESHLLPQQMKRLKELQIRQDFNATNSSFHKGAPLVKLLDLSESQIKQLSEKSPGFQEKLRKDVATFIEKRRFEFLATILTEKQLGVLESSIGDNPAANRSTSR